MTDFHHEDSKSFHTLDDFEIGRPLGCGEFGQVWLVRHKTTNLILALKIIDKSRVKHESSAKQIRREIEVHSNLKHSNILRMYGYFYDKQRIYIVLEYATRCGMFEILQRYRRFDEEKTATYIFQVSRALYYMHKNNVIHRDLKPENILVTYDNTIKIADFGWAVKNVDNKRYTLCGTLEYLAPEICKEERHDTRLDMWCIGILTYEFLTGYTPFECKNKTFNEMKPKILEMKYEIPDFISVDGKDFIKRLLVYEKDRRMKIEEIHTHPWIRKHISQKIRDTFYDD